MSDVARTIFSRGYVQKGYRLIYCPFHPAARRDGHVLEHRLILERKLGRFLLRSEHVHHLNGDTLDNRPENLEPVSGSRHRVLHLSRISDEQIVEMIRGGIPAVDISAMGVSTGRVVRVRKSMGLAPRQRTAKHRRRWAKRPPGETIRSGWRRD